MKRAYFQNLKLDFGTWLNILLLIIACVVLSSEGREWLRERSLVLHTGDQVPAMSGVNWGMHDRTLVLALKSGCPYCEGSVPFYLKLASAVAAQRAKTPLVAIVPHDARPEEQLFRVYELNVPVIGSVDFARLKIAGTPTLLLVDSSARVRKIWIGKLDSKGEADVMSALGIRADESAITGAFVPLNEGSNGGPSGLLFQRFHAATRGLAGPITE